MSLLSQATEYNSGENSSKFRQRPARTIKKHHDSPSRQKNMESLMQLTSMSDDEDESGLADFKPMKPELTRTPQAYDPKLEQQQQPDANQVEQAIQQFKTNSNLGSNPNMSVSDVIGHSNASSLSRINRASSQYNHLSQPATLNDAYSTSQNLQDTLNNFHANSNSNLASNYNLGNSSNINEQLNYIIHLLEEQQNSKTSTTTEELILYTFLGVFTIYIVDSFTKVGKSYTR